ncbi:unnamed protein product [Fraxinus pennsylvanica]|uniref:Uncharacterized protein n=1 Tax=Fraxinus pennsylvanica TaxID=56036 RepID=A0AAD1ZVY4_9LAMI|nr:unnamed protein product [Fraxinus pennsylvanica]
MTFSRPGEVETAKGNAANGFGVECSNKTGHVIGLDLLYRSFGDGPIPDTFGELNFLEELRVSGNMFQEIPTSLGNLSHLSILLISDNALNESLPHLLRKLSGIASKSLEWINLHYNQLVDSFPDITQFSSLKELSLGNNQLKEFHSQRLGRPSSLETLDLSNNKLGGSLPDLRAYSSLQELHVYGNQLERLPESIWQLSKLKILDLSSNSLEGTITEYHLSKLAYLDVLDLSYNSLALNTSSDWTPPFQLSSLYLRFCNVGPDFPKWLQTQKSLSYLDMSFASISDTLPTWLWNMPSLSNLNLSSNHISGGIPHLSPNFTGISYLDLSYNNFSGPIPSFLSHSIKLQLSKNMFSGSIFQLCTTFTHLNLEVLDLSDNQLTGELPDCWMNSSSLRVLNLANNNFSGKIPPTLGHNPRLQILHLRNNNFVGELPSSLKNCTWLRMLDVGGNKLTGTIPEWIGTHLTSLTVLSLRFNKFHGNIDPTICYLTNIQVLDLSRNNISGEIPQCFNYFTSLVQKYSSMEGNSFYKFWTSFYHFYLDTYVDNALVQWKGQEKEYRKLGLLRGIDLSSNKLVGNIPHQFSDLRALVFLNLSRNHLTGNIISSIGQMEMLEWLDLSRNKLSGKIPSSLAELHFLSVLDLSYNNLTGMIPLGTQLQSFNTSAYAGNSQLCGLPLAECPRDSPYPSSIDHGKGNYIEEDDEFISREFYICMAFGFITGFWAVIDSRESFGPNGASFQKQEVSTVYQTSWWLERCRGYG